MESSIFIWVLWRFLAHSQSLSKHTGQRKEKGALPVLQFRVINIYWFSFILVLNIFTTPRNVYLNKLLTETLSNTG